MLYNRKMHQFSSKPLMFLIVGIILSLLTFDATLLFSGKVQATCTDNPDIVKNGLITAGSVTHIGNTVLGYTSPCIKGTDSAYAGFPDNLTTSYDKLKEQYYNRSSYRCTWNVAGGSKQLKVNGCPEGVFNQPSLKLGNQVFDDVKGMTGNPNGSYVIFVDGDLEIDDDVISGNYTNGSLVFIVGGNINIATSVHQIDASLTAQGQICDSYESGSCNPSPTAVSASSAADGLVISGSVIDLCSSTTTPVCAYPLPIAFHRTFTDNSLYAAETITTQAKNLVNLKDILSTTLSIQTQQ